MAEIRRHVALRFAAVGVLAASAALTAACGDDDAADPEPAATTSSSVELTTTSPEASSTTVNGGATTAPTTATTAPASTSTSTSAPEVALPDDVGAMTLPAAVCEMDAPSVTLEGGAADNTSARAAAEWGDPGFVVLVDPTSEVREDLDGDGAADLAVVAYCGAYAGGNNSFVHVLAFAAGPDGLVLLGDLGPDDHGSLVREAALSVVDGRLHSEDRFLLDGDADCCPTGEGFTEWQWNGTGFDVVASGER
ncbi:MAG: hypothetical protein S0880_17510 [Actinomycetota bacterium]|nr:hypothetical protein [Actinomycetota bacterium]